MEMLKKVPLPIWIGLGLVLIVIVVMNGKAGSQQQNQQPSTTAPVGPVTTATVGTQGAQSNAGTDQELGNLSVITQGGFSQLAQQEQGNQLLLGQLAGGMNGVGTPMQQFGTSMQGVQNGSAQANATAGTAGQNAGSNPSVVASSPNNG